MPQACPRARLRVCLGVLTLALLLGGCSGVYVPGWLLVVLLFVGLGALQIPVTAVDPRHEARIAYEARQEAARDERSAVERARREAAETAQRDARAKWDTADRAFHLAARAKRRAASEQTS